MLLNMHPKGKHGEEAARKILEQKDYEILETNFHTRLGEIDIVAFKDNDLYIFEVKAYQAHTYHLIDQVITPRKIKHLVKAAQFFYFAILSIKTMEFYLKFLNLK